LLNEAPSINKSNPLLGRACLLNMRSTLTIYTAPQKVVVGIHQEILMGEVPLYH